MEKEVWGMKIEGIVKEIIPEPGNFWECSKVWIKTKEGNFFDFPPDEINKVKIGKRYKFYRHCIFWGINSITELRGGE